VEASGGDGAARQQRLPALRLLIGDATRARFAGPLPTLAVELDRASAVLGRSPDADVVLEDRDGNVSRGHLVFERSGLRWSVTDLGSTHGTKLWQPGAPGAGIALRAYVPHPLSSGVRLELAGAIQLSVTIAPLALRGDPTRSRERPPARVRDAFPPPELLPLAYALTAAPTHGGRRRPTVADVANELDVAPQRVYEQVDRLAALPAVAPFLQMAWWRQPAGRRERRPAGWLDDLAGALATAYPELFGGQPPAPVP